jgi:uncharacterized DUF497 family protein
MDITFDPNKYSRNIEERGISFECAADFDFDTAKFVNDDRKNYGEIRMRALGFIGDRLHALVFTETETGIRVISLRKANKCEVKLYEQET